MEPGGQVTFTITIANNANNANTSATDVEVTDALPAGMTLVSGMPSGNGTFDTQSLVWSLVDPLMPGAQQTLTIVADVNAGVQGNSTLSNVAQVTAANETDVDSTPANDDGDQSEDDEDGAMFNVDAVIDLSLTKTASVETTSPGEQVTWTLTLTNDVENANAAATNVQITDVMPDGLSITNSSASGNGQFSDGVWSLVDPLEPGAMATLTLTTTVDGNIQAGDHTNTAQVTAADQDDVDSTPGNDDGDQSEDDEAADTVTVEPQIDLELTKSVNVNSVDPGDAVNWTIQLTNNADNANADATGVTVTDVLPAGIALVTSTPSKGSFTGDTWDVGTLTPGETATLTLATTVDNSVDGGAVIENTAQVGSAVETDIDSRPANDDGDQSEDDEDNAEITVRSIVDLELEKTVNEPAVEVDDEVTWTIVVTNNAAEANTAATGVTIADVFPSGTSFVSATPTLGTFDQNTGIWTLGAALQPGQSATLTVVSRIDSASGGQTLVNTAQVATQDQPDVDSTPGNGQQNEDDDDLAEITVQLQRPMSKRSLLATS